MKGFRNQVNYLNYSWILKEFENTALSLKGTIYGTAPVQAEEIVNGFPFYFRARHDIWTFSISELQEVDPVDIQLIEQGEKYGFFAEGQIGKESEYAASYLGEKVVLEIIEKCCIKYIDTR